MQVNGQIDAKVGPRRQRELCGERYLTRRESNSDHSFCSLISIANEIQPNGCISAAAIALSPITIASQGKLQWEPGVRRRSRELEHWNHFRGMGVSRLVCVCCTSLRRQSPHNRQTTPLVPSSPIKCRKKLNTLANIPPLTGATTAVTIIVICRKYF